MAGGAETECVCVTRQECESLLPWFYMVTKFLAGDTGKKVLNVDPLIRVFIYWLCLLEL